MVNLEHKLTVDDLIVEYMVYKTKNGYEPQFLTSEFMSFLHYFEEKMSVGDVLYDNEKLFDRFFERKSEHDWSTPHMDVIYSEKDRDYLIKANYKLSEYDISVINTYFMPGGQWGQGKVKEIRNIISEYLKDEPKREVDMSITIEPSNLLMGKYLAAEIVDNLWKSYLKGKVNNLEWPSQCRDINKYLLKLDLAPVIGLKSMKKDIIEFYDVISKRLAIMYQQDNKLRIGSQTGSHLAKGNYEVLIRGYEKMFDMSFGKYKQSFQIDMEKLSFTECHEARGIYDWDEEPELESREVIIGNGPIKKLVKNLEKHSKLQNIKK